MKNEFWCLILMLMVVGGGASAQPDVSNDPLYKTVAGLDTQLFDAYNHCDLEKFRSLLDENIEFYHDKTGLMVGAGNVTSAIKENICGKVTRELVPGTLEVYPIQDYGAVEIGVHRFHHPGKDDDVGEAKFINLWQNKNGVWKVTRVLSIDHHMAAKDTSAR